MTNSEIQLITSDRPSPTPEILTALKAGIPVDSVELYQFNLKEVDFRQANLSKAKLLGADLSEVVLSNVDLSGADLRGANLQGADLSGANLQGAYLNRAEALCRKCKAHSEEPGSRQVI